MFDSFVLTDFVMFSSFNQIFRVVDTLSAWKNFFASHEHVVWVGIFGIVGIGHGVERTNRQRELVQHVKVSIVLGLHQSTQELLIRGWQIFLVTRFNASFTQHAYGLMELELEWWFQEFEWLHIELLTNGSDFTCVTKNNLKLLIKLWRQLQVNHQLTCHVVLWTSQWKYCQWYPRLHGSDI